MSKATKAKTKKNPTVTPGVTGPRTIWTGVISFGLLTVPVKVSSATKDYKFSFHTFRCTDLSPICFKKVAQADGVEVKADQIVKGYQEGKNGPVTVITDSDLETLNLPSTKTIDIDAFVDASEIETRLLVKSYFLEASNGGLPGYSILYTALLDTGKVGVAKIALRNREYLAIVRPDPAHQLLQLDVIRFSTELVKPNLTPADPETVTPELRKLARQLIASGTKKFQIENYRNNYIDALGDLIAKKQATAGLPNGVTATTATQINPMPDMVAILKASMKAD